MLDVVGGATPVVVAVGRLLYLQGTVSVVLGKITRCSSNRVVEEQFFSPLS